MKQYKRSWITSASTITSLLSQDFLPVGILLRSDYSNFTLGAIYGNYDGCCSNSKPIDFSPTYCFDETVLFLQLLFQIEAFCCDFVFKTFQQSFIIASADFDSSRSILYSITMPNYRCYKLVSCPDLSTLWIRIIARSSLK